MELEAAKTILDGCVRSELRDHAFGDKEVTWTRGDTVIATGYAGSSEVSVTMENGDFSCTGDDARSLMSAGTLGEVGRNDETGPDEFVEGAVMPGLTLEGVRQELEGTPATKFSQMRQAYSPKNEELTFFSVEEGVRYARNAGFTVKQNDGSAVATRADIPDTTYVLKYDGKKHYWFSG